MIYGWLIDWVTDFTVWGLTIWLNYFLGWLIDWVTDFTVWGLTNWLNDLWLVNWLSNWFYCLGTDQLTEWFPIELSRFWPNDWMINGWLIDWLINSTVRELTNWLNDLWLVDWLTDWPGLLMQTWFYFTEWTTYCLDSTVWVDCMFLLVNFFIYCELCGEVLKSLVLSFNSISCGKNGYKLSGFLLVKPRLNTAVTPRSIFTSLVIFPEEQKTRIKH